MESSVLMETTLCKNMKQTIGGTMRAYSFAFLIAAAMIVAMPVLGWSQDIRIGDVRVVEGDSGIRDATFAVLLSAPAQGTVTLSYITRDGTATAGSDYRAANGTVSFAKAETKKSIAVGVVGDTAVEADETFALVLNNASGVTVTGSTGTATIINDDFPAINDDSPVRTLTAYEVRFSFRGYSGSQAGNDCPDVRRNGTVVMTGLIMGYEAVDSEHSIYYRGDLQLNVDVDLCEAKQVPDGDAYCFIRVFATGPIRASLELTADDRGAYIKAESPPRGLLMLPEGNCGKEAEIEEIRAFPDNSEANVFNGVEFNLTSRPLKVGRYVDGDMTLEVIRRFRVSKIQ